MNTPLPQILEVRLLNDRQAEARIHLPDGERRYRFALEVLEGIRTVEAARLPPRGRPLSLHLWPGARSSARTV